MRWQWNGLLLGLLVGCGDAALWTGGDDDEWGSTEHFVRATRPIQGEYLVVLAPHEDGEGWLRARQGELLRLSGGQLLLENGVGFSARMTESAARRLSRHRDVRFVEENGRTQLAAVESTPSWALDRIDQRALPLDEEYDRQGAGAGVHVYVMDTGIRRTHRQFDGRVDMVLDRVRTAGDDCHGHGTHVAGIVGARTLGVANGVQLHALRVLGCDGFGKGDDLTAAVAWVTRNHRKPAVVNMSVSVGRSPALDRAIEQSIGAGVTYVVSAGNDSVDACKASISGTRGTLAVAATNDQDELASFSNHGKCVGVLAPGVDVLSTFGGDDDAYQYLHGTSMAAPVVTGVAALYLERFPTARPKQVVEALVAGSTPDAGKVPEGTSGRLVFAPFVAQLPVTPVPPDGGTPGRADAGLPADAGFAPPSIEVESPPDRAVVSARDVVIRARVHHSGGLAEVRLRWVRTDRPSAPAEWIPCDDRCVVDGDLYTWSFTSGGGLRHYQVVATDSGGATFSSPRRAVFLR